MYFRIDLIQKTIDGLEGRNVPFEFIANLDIAWEIIKKSIHLS